MKKLLLPVTIGDAASVTVGTQPHAPPFLLVKASIRSLCMQETMFDYMKLSL